MTERIGDTNRFAVEFELLEKSGGVWMFGHGCYWFDGRRVGDWVEATSLLGLLTDEQVAGHAVIALGKLRAGSARQAIEALLRKSPRPWVRKEAEKGAEANRRRLAGISSALRWRSRLCGATGRPAATHDTSVILRIASNT